MTTTVSRTHPELVTMSECVCVCVCVCVWERERIKRKVTQWAFLIFQLMVIMATNIPQYLIVFMLHYY